MNKYQFIANEQWIDSAQFNKWDNKAFTNKEFIKRNKIDLELYLIFF